MAQAQLDRVLFMPAGDPWQKSDRVLTPASLRLEMVRVAVKGVDGFELDAREVEREGPTYTNDSLASFPADEELFLILGADAAAGIPTWHRWEEVVARAGILVVPRLGTDMAEVVEKVPSAVALDMAILEVSATAIRSMAASGEAYRFLVPPPVFEFIETKSLYAQAPRGDRVGMSNEQEDSP